MKNRIIEKLKMVEGGVRNPNVNKTSVVNFASHYDTADLYGEDMGRVYSVTCVLGATKIINSSLVKSPDRAKVFEVIKREVSTQVAEQLYGDITKELLEVRRVYMDKVMEEGTYMGNDVVLSRIDDILEMCRA